jgi:hypothetical protein
VVSGSSGTLIIDHYLPGCSSKVKGRGENRREELLCGGANLKRPGSENLASFSGNEPNSLANTLFSTVSVEPFLMTSKSIFHSSLAAIGA